MKENSSQGFFKTIYLILGILTAVGLVGYGLTYLVWMPKVDPAGFSPQSLGTSSGSASARVIAQSIFILIYAFSFLPVTVMFTVKNYQKNPYGLVLAGCLAVLSFIIEIINNLPAVASAIHPGRLSAISPEVMLYLHQADSLRYLSYDVPGFSLAYAAIFIYAIIYWPTHRRISYIILGSILLFLANVPFLWVAPNAAVILMVFSIFAFAPVPLFLAREAIK
jgi:hypothetical protein